MRASLSLIFVTVLFTATGCQIPTTGERPRFRHESELALWLHRASIAEIKGNAELLRKATAKVAEHWREQPGAPTGGYRLEITSSRHDTAKPLFFDSFEPADECKVDGLNTRYTRDGIGAPLIGTKKFPDSDPLSKYQPDDGIERAVTAVLTFPERKRARLAFYDPGKTIELNGKPVTADFSAPLSNALGDVGKMRRLGLAGMFRTGDPKFQAGFLLTQPYDPNRTPLVLVHGLLSSQIAWRNMANDLIAEPEIRKRYQIWFYHYPTGNPVLLSAEVFRRNLNQLRKDLDPTGRDPAMQKTVVVGHSMGGLLTKTLITTTGDLLWKQAFTVTKDELLLEPAKKKMVVDSFYWKARPEVKRVIYVAVPHRGSNLATSFIARMVQRIIRLPETLISVTTDIVRLDADALTEEALQTVERLNFSSIANLSPEDNTLQALNELPTAPWVHRHSIIGNRGKPGPIEKSSDGIVPYTSSHINGVDSEIIVPGDHGAYKTPEALVEIIRILKLP